MISRHFMGTTLSRLKVNDVIPGVGWRSKVVKVHRSPDYQLTDLEMLDKLAKMKIRPNTRVGKKIRAFLKYYEWFKENKGDFIVIIPMNTLGYEFQRQRTPIILNQFTEFYGGKFITDYPIFPLPKFTNKYAEALYIDTMYSAIRSENDFE